MNETAMLMHHRGIAGDRGGVRLERARTALSCRRGSPLTQSHSSAQFFAVLLIGAFCMAVPAHSQEAQVPVDEEGKLELIEADLAAELGLFGSYPGFSEARLFRVADSTFVLEIYYESAGEILKVRDALSRDEASALRRDVTARIQMTRPTALLDRKGRGRFLWRTFVLSYGFYSWSLPYSVGLDMGETPAGVVSLVTGSAGFFAPFVLTGKMPVSKGQAALSDHGGKAGILYGVLLSELLSGEDNTWRRGVSFGLAGSLAGLAGSYSLAGRTRMSEGTAELIGLGGFYGLGMAAGTADLLGLFNDDGRRALAGIALLGSGLGYLGGHRLSRTQSYTRGDVGVINLSGYLGSYLTLTALRLANADGESASVAATMAGATLGLGLGNSLVGGRDFEHGDSRMMTLGSVGGYLLGGAATLLIDGDNDDLGLSLTTAGALTGFWLTYRSYAGEARGEDTSWRFELSPTALMANARRSDDLSGLSTPAISCTYRF